MSLTTTVPQTTTSVTLFQVTAEQSPVHSEAQDYQHALKIANQFRRREDLKGLFAIMANYAVIGACVMAAEQNWVFCRAVYMAACLVISSRLRGFENLVHEASHYNLFTSPAMHYKLQGLYAFPVLRVLSDYRRGHLVHHQHLGDAARDPDLVRIRALGLDRVPEAPFYYLFALPLSGAIHWEYMATTFVEFWTSSEAYPGKAAFWAAVLGVAAFHDATARLLGLYYAVPFFLILPVLRYWAEAAEHLGLDLTGKFGNSRSNLGLAHAWFSTYPLSPVLPFYSHHCRVKLANHPSAVHPHNDGFHAVHHLHAQVPFHQLPTAHAALMEESAAFRTRTVCSDGFIDTFLQMARNPILMKHTAGTT